MQTKVKIENVSVNKTTHNHGLSKKTSYKVHIYSFDDFQVTYDFENRESLYIFLGNFFECIWQRIHDKFKLRVAIDKNTFQGVKRFGVPKSHFSNLQYFPNCCARAQVINDKKVSVMDYRFFLEKCKSSVNTQK